MHERIGKYHVIRAAGSGGFGTVYEGYDVELDRNVAIKICTSDDEGQLQRFQREARVVSQLKHRNIALVYDYGFDPEAGLYFLVEEFLSGVDLEKKLEDRDRLPPSLRVRYLMEIAQGLEFVHNRGLIHRDLSPRNIRVLHDHSIKLMDFGLAKDITDSTLTLVGDNFGTVGYTAPEQITGMREVDHRTDIFSFGVVAYELLTWKNPFKAENMGSFIHKVNHVEPTPLTEAWPPCPPDLAEVVHRCIHKSADDRFDSCADVIPVLKRTLRFLRENETPQPHVTRNFEGTPEDGARVVGGDVRFDSDDSTGGPSSSRPGEPSAEAEVGSGRRGSRSALLGGRVQMVGTVAALIALVGLTALLAVTWRQDMATRAAEAPGASAPPAPAEDVRAPPQPPSAAAGPGAGEVEVPAEESRVTLSPKLFKLQAVSRGRPEDRLIVLEAVLPSFGELSHCYLVRSPPWSYGAKVRRECQGGSFQHEDRLELRGGESYTYRIQLAGASGEILAEAASEAVLLE